jgi:exopolyphosphatase/guanosine-5'-triphosphate,3'-diphosphate pyrophosphatase
LDGEWEPYYDALGVLNEISMQRGVVLDIGGGSIPLSQVAHGQFQHGVSLTLGALALTERSVGSDPIAPQEYGAVWAEIQRQLDRVPWLDALNEEACLVGLGGTIRNLARVEGKRQAYSMDTLHGFRLSRASLERSIELFRELLLKERKDISGLKSDRSDIILPGAMVLRAVMERFAVDDVIVIWDADHLRLTLVTDQYPVVELWQAERNAVPLLERAFRRRIQLDSVIAPSDWVENGGLVASEA